MEMKIINVADLIGPVLDWAVAQCENKILFSHVPSSKHYFAPTKEWVQGGPIIERERLNISPISSGVWECWPDFGMSNETWQKGPTPLIAAMRCFVAIKMGDTVSVPVDLCNFHHQTIKPSKGF